MRDFTIVFVHGTGGPDADWLPSIGEEMKRRHVSFEIPALPTTIPIQVDDWINGLHKTVSNIRGPIIFVGYSLGTRAVLLYLEKYKMKADHIFLVAAFSNDTKNTKMESGEYSSFFTNKIDTRAIKENVGKITILHSEDDWCIPYSQAVELSKEIGAELISYKDKGHFTDPDCYKDVLEILVNRVEI